MQSNGETPNRQFWIDDFFVDPTGLTLHGPLGEITLESKIMQVLVTLADNAGQVVSRDTLMDKVWAVEYGSDESLTRAISILRKSFGDAHGRRSVIETIPRTGYKLVGTVSQDGPVHQAGIPGQSADQPKPAFRRRWILGAAALLILAFVGYSVLNPSFKQTPDEFNASVTVRKTEQTTIAVLPFDDLSPNKDQDYFARGISEELLNVLAKTEGLRVSSRSSAFAFKDQGRPIAQIAKELDVGHILEGSVRKSGETLRITAQLIDPNTDVHLWSETYDRPLTIDNIFDVQDEISAAIVKALKGQLTITPEASTRPVSLEAFELYIKARDDHNKRLPETLKAAEAGFKKVIELDPNFAPAYSGLADTYMLMPEYAGTDPSLAKKFAEPNVKRALDLAPASAEALTTAALFASAYQGDADASLDYAVRAIEANPNYSIAYHRQGFAYRAKGEDAKALESVKAGLKLDPNSSAMQANLAYHQMKLGDYDGSRATSEALIRNHPDSVHGYIALIDLSLELGDYENYHRYLKECEARNPTHAGTRYSLYLLYRDSGLFDQARTYATNPYQILPIYLYELNAETVKRLAQESRNTGNDNIAHFKGDVERALRQIEPEINSIVPEGQALNRYSVAPAANIAFLYQQLGSPKAKPFIELLETYFEDSSPSEYSAGNELNAGAMLQMLRGNPQDAFAWIERKLDLNRADLDLRLPVYDQVRALPEFAALQARNDEILAKRRAAIEEQLANPKPNWVMNE